MSKKTERIFTKVYSIKDYLEVLQRHGDKTLYRWPKNREYLSISYEEFYNKVISIAKGYAACGLGGKCVAVVGETSVEWVASYLATLAMGGTVVPIDKELDVEAIEGFLETANAEAIVYSKSFNQKLAGLPERHATVKYLIPTDNTVEETETTIPLDTLIERGAGTEFNVTERNTDELAVMLFTSGTTGTSKCVKLCERNIWSTVNSACATVEFFKEDTIVSVLPLHHTYELAVMLSALNYGMEVGINDSLRNLMKNFNEFKPTGLVLVPLFVNTMYKRIFDKAEKAGSLGKLKFGLKIAPLLPVKMRRKLFRDVIDGFGGRLEKIVCGGAPLNPEMVKVFAKFGITISEGYGITECSPLISVNPYYALKSGSVGPAVPSCTVRIAENDVNDRGFAEGEEVDVVVRPEDVDIVPVERGMVTGTVTSVTFRGVHFEIIVEVDGFKWMIQTTDEHHEGDRVGIFVEPDAIHIMKKSEYSGLYGDYSSYSDELDELSIPYDDDEDEEPEEEKAEAEE